MSFNRSGYIGRAPGDSSIVLAKQYFQPTGAGKTFTFTSGYDPGLLDVYRNGVKLINVLDYAATDGSTVVLDTPVGVGSTVQIVAYKGFNVTEVSSSAGDFSVGTNLYVQSGFGSFSQGITANQINVSGITTTVDLNVSGAATVSGTVVAGSFSGDGSALTGVGQTLNVRTLSLTVAGVSTFTGALNATSVVSSGAVSGTTGTFSGAVAGTTGTFSGAVNVDATTDSTSSTSGALIVDGGLGVAKNVYIGAGLSVAGTLTYEDVTNVDSVGLITAKSGVNVSGGQVTIGTGITMGIAGVATFSGTSDVHLLDSVELKVGDGSDLKIYHNGTDSIIDNSTGNLKVIAANDVTAIQVFNDGTVNIGSDTDDIKLRFGIGSDLQIYHDGTHSYIDNTTGDLRITDTGGGGIIIGSDSLDLRNSARDEKYFNGTANGAVSLYYDNSVKIATTSAGVTVTGTVSDSKGDVRKIIQNSTTGSYTLVVADAGKHVLATGTVTIPNSTFAAGDAVTIVNNSGSDITLTASVGTLYNTADAATGNRTLAGRGMATILFSSATVAYISGAGLS